MGAAASIAEPDPWAGCAPDEALRRVKAEDDTPIVVSSDDGEETDVGALLNAALVAGGGGGGAARVNLDGCELGADAFAALPASALAAVRARATVLVLSGNALTDAFSPWAALGATRLRALHLANNELTACPAGLGAACPLLADLDLSYNEGLQLAARDALGAPPPPLARLQLAGCALTDDALAAASAALGAVGATLRELALADNVLGDAAAFGAALAAARLVALAELDARENEVCDERGYRDAALGACPALARLDGASLRGLAGGGGVRALVGPTGCLGLDESNNGLLGDAAAMATLEKEVADGLAGKADSTVIS